MSPAKSVEEAKEIAKEIAKDLMEWFFHLESALKNPHLLNTCNKDY